jgi:TolB-like protein
VTDRLGPVFLSYTSQDVAAARRIAETLVAAGIEVWFDQSELRGGDQWDRKIRRQVNDCALFIAVISANTEQRREGYFRLEWKLAVDRSQMMDDDAAFLVPAVIDSTKEATARVPDRFRQVQWMNVPDGHVHDLGVEHLVALLRGEERDERHGAPDHVPVKKLTRGSPAVRWLWAGGLLLALALGGVWMTLHRRAPDAPPTTELKAPPSHPRIAVLPFENLSPDSSNAFFADGVHEELLTTLANETKGIDVISSTTMSVYRGKPVLVPTLAHELNCTYVLEGSVRREGNQVRLTLQLIDARDDRQIWSESYDRTLGNSIALEREVAAAVSSRLALKLSGVAPSHVTSTDPAAYDLYLKARAAENAALDNGGSLAGLQNATHLLDQAIQADPNFVRALLERMSLRVQLFLLNYALPDDVLPQAEADLAAAQRLAASDPVVIAYSALMAFAKLDYNQALDLFESAERAGVADPELLDWKRELLFAMGRYPESAALAARLADLDPKNVGAQGSWVYMLMELHQYREALHLVDALNAGDPEYWQEERTMVVAYAGGNFAPRHAGLAAQLAKPWHTEDDVQANFLAAIVDLPMEHRFEDMRRHIDESPIDSVRATYRVFNTYRCGRTPLADDRGWMDLLLGDRTEQRKDGKKILSFLSRTAETPWNKWFRTMLRADAELFMGDTQKANQTAAAAVALTRSRPDVSDQMGAYIWSTQILAWTERKDEAVARLTAMSSSVPGLWPGEIVENPKYTIPLSDNAGYQALRERLKKEMSALDLK